MENGARECEWRPAPEARGGFGVFWKSQLVEFCLGRRRFAFAYSPKSGQWPCGGCHKYCRGIWKSQNKKNVYLSPYVEEPFNLKVIKSFVPELRSRKCFSCFDIPMFYVYIYKHYEHSMNVSHIRIWLWYIYIIWCRGLGMSFMAWLRLGVHTIRETAKNMGSISNSLFRRWKEREKIQGPQKTKKQEKSSTPKTRRKKCSAPSRKIKEKRRKTAKLQEKKKKAWRKEN